MGLTDVLNWWNRQKDKHSKDMLCGVWPFQTNKLDPFLAYCIVHDTKYSESELLYAKGVVENNEDLKLEGLRIKAQADLDFYAGCRKRAAKSSILVRPILKRWAEQYVSLVTLQSESIWFQSIGEKIAYYEAGKGPLMLQRDTGYDEKTKLEAFIKARKTWRYIDPKTGKAKESD